MAIIEILANKGVSISGAGTRVYEISPSRGETVFYVAFVGFPYVDITGLDARIIFQCQGGYNQYSSSLTFSELNETFEEATVGVNAEGTIKNTLALPYNQSTLEITPTQGIISKGLRIEVPIGYYNGLKMGTKTTTKLVFEVPDATVSNLVVTGNNAQANIGLSWLATNNDAYNVEVYQENILKHNYIGGTQLSHTVPANTLGVGTTEFKVRTGKVVSGTTYWSNFITQSVTLVRNQPTIDNLNNVGEYWESPIEINWRSDYQDGYQAELYQNNVKVGNTLTGTTAKVFTLAAETFANKDNVNVRVRTFNTYLGVIAYSGWSEINLNLKDITATVDNLNLSGSNIDLQLTASWNSLYQQNYELIVVKNGVTVKTYTGTTAKQVIIPAATLTTGLHTFRVKVAYKNRWTDYKDLNTTLIETLPSIGVLEPDGVIVERDNPIRIWWTSNNQSEWTLVIDGTLTYTGTTTKEKILTAATLQTGNHAMTLTIAYVTGAGARKYTSITSKFIVQGKPPTPTITSSSTFTISRPVITWDTQDQQGYILEVLKDGVIVYTTEWQNGLITQRKINEYLANGTYVARVKVINQYSLESAYGTKAFTVNATEITQIQLVSLLVGASVELKWDNPSNKFTAFYIIRNKVVIHKTTNTSFADYMAYGECTYTVRGITANDVYKDSNEVYAEIIVRRGLMATIDNPSDTIDVGITAKPFAFNANIGLECQVIQLSGRELPVAIFGEHSSNTYSISFVQKDFSKFVQMCKKRKTFIYRDRRQKLFLTILNPSYNVTNFYTECNPELIEVDFKEGVAYD